MDRKTITPGYNIETYRKWFYYYDMIDLWIRKIGFLLNGWMKISLKKDVNLWEYSTNFME